jgi:hypothetical protein
MAEEELRGMCQDLLNIAKQDMAGPAIAEEEHLLDTDEQDELIDSLASSQEKQALVWRRVFCCVWLFVACVVAWVGYQSSVREKSIEEFASIHLSTELSAICMALAVMAAAIFIQARSSFTRRACGLIAAIMIIQPVAIFALSSPDHAPLVNEVHRQAFQLLVATTVLVWLFTLYLDHEFDAELLAGNIEEMQDLRYKFKKA